MAASFQVDEAYIRDMLLEEWVLGRIAQEEAQKEVEQMKESLGGVPGQLGVMLNGEYISFPDAAPESVDGRIMVPYRALMEALGGDVAYDAATQTVSCILDGTTLTLKLGENTLTMDENGVVSTLEMDCAAYVKDNRTYVPVRFISQAFGYDVLWDLDFETAVLVDEEALAARIDEQFTILNRALDALTPDPEQALQTTAAVQADVTLFDSIAGDKSYRFDGAVSGIVQGGVAQGELNMDLSALNEMLELDALMEEYIAWNVPAQEELDAINGLIDSLGGLSLEYIENAETKTFYVRSPLLALIDESWEDAWLALGADNAVFLPGKLTVGGICCALGMSSVEAGYDSPPVYAICGILEAGESLAELLGDRCFTHTDAGDVFTLNPAALGLEGEYNPYSELEFTFTVADSGAVAGSFYAEMSENSLTGWNGAAVIVDGAFSLGESSRTLTLDLHAKNTFRLELKAEAESTLSASAPLTAPPEGDTVIGPEEGLYNLNF